MRKMFLIDRLGGVTSALLTGVLLPLLDLPLGLGWELLCSLGAIGTCFAATRSCVGGTPDEKDALGVMIANVLYCACTGMVI